MEAVPSSLEESMAVVLRLGALEPDTSGHVPPGLTCRGAFEVIGKFRSAQPNEEGASTIV